MQLSTWIINQTTISPKLLFGPNGLVYMEAAADGSINITRWNIPNVSQPTPDQIKAILAQPEPVNTAAVKGICSDFIFSYASATTQMNATAMMLAATPTAAQTSGYQALQTWIKSCRAQCDALISASDTDYANQKTTYPVPGSDVTDFLKTV